VWGAGTGTNTTFQVTNNASTTVMRILDNGTTNFYGSTTTIDNLFQGALSFPSDGGVLSWVDMPVTSSDSDNTVESYSAQIDGNPVLTVYGQSDGTGGVDNLRVGVGTTTPWRTFSVSGTVAMTGLTSSTAGNAICILASGDVVNAGGTACTTSSKRFKKNIIPLEDALSILMKLEAVEYDRKDNGKHEIGLIAEQVNEVYPFLVEYEIDGVTPRGVDYLHLTALIVQAVQEQQVQINSINREKQGETPFNIILLITVIGLGVLVIKKK